MIETLRRIILLKVGGIERDYYDRVCLQLARANAQYYTLQDYLRTLHDTTPHDTVKQEIKDVLCKADDIGY
jgi:hypothetical protein